MSRTLEEDRNKFLAFMSSVDWLVFIEGERDKLGLPVCPVCAVFGCRWRMFDRFLACRECVENPRLTPQDSYPCCEYPAGPQRYAALRRRLERNGVLAFKPEPSAWIDGV